MAKPEEKVSFGGRLKQIGMVFSFTAKQDKMFLPLAVGAVLIPLLLAALAVVLGWGLIFIPLGVLIALLALLIVLNIRSNRAMMNAAEGQPGAAASIIENMRGDWRVRAAVSSTTSMDMIHLVVGKPGVILLAEGNPQRVRGMLGQEKRRLAKVIGNAPLHDYVIGNGDNEVPIRKLRMTLTKLPRALSGKDVNSLDKRLTALSSARPQLPKGAIPKNMRPPKGAFRQTRGR